MVEMIRDTHHGHHHHAIALRIEHMFTPALSCPCLYPDVSSGRKDTYAAAYRPGTLVRMITDAAQVIKPYRRHRHPLSPAKGQPPLVRVGHDRARGAI
jgi:hypothetical protein